MTIKEYIFHNFDKDIIDYEKNINEGINIDKISHYSNKELWIKCINKPYHNSYKISAKKIVEGKTTGSLCCPSCLGIIVNPIDSFYNKYREYSKFWDTKRNKVSPKEVKYNDDNYYYFHCNKCDYTFKRNLKRIRELPFKHICLHDREKILKDQQDNKSKKEYIAFLKAYNEVIDKYNGDWILIDFIARHRPCILKHSCGKIKKITRFNNVLSNNLICDCEK